MRFPRHSFLSGSSVSASGGEGHFAFKESLGGPSQLELLEPPLQNQLSDISERPPLPQRELFEFGSQVSTDPQAEWSFPFPHGTPGYLRPSRAERNVRSEGFQPFVCFVCGVCFRAKCCRNRRESGCRLGQASSRKILALGRLHPTPKIDNVSCSHGCTLPVRLWSGACRCYQRRRVPLHYLSSLFLRLLLFLPRPQYFIRL